MATTRKRVVAPVATDGAKDERRKRLLILSASAGHGHFRCGQAVEQACAQLGFGWDVHHIDILDYTNPLFKTVYSKMYIDMMTKMPEVLGWLYDQLDKPWKGKDRKLAFDKLHVGPFVRLLERQKPDVVFCTHSLPAEIISWLRSRPRKPMVIRQAIVITDFDVHALWLCPHYEHYFVALPETRVHLEELGVPAEKITVSGIPVDPRFREVSDKAALRRKHGLDPGRTTLLISAGGYGVGRVETVISLLLRLRHEAQVIAVCGKNAELKARLDDMAATQDRHPRVKLKVVGYTNAMHELMGASDLIVGKPGGMTMCEALASGLVWVVVNPIPGQEERNSDHLLEEGCALKCNNLPTLPYKIDQLLDDPERLARMHRNALRLARPDAAFVIAETLRRVADMPMPELPAAATEPDEPLLPTWLFGPRPSSSSEESP
jgi:processive 1,2-diacylglycerol beta-glucosyltransferase